MAETGERKKKKELLQSRVKNAHRYHRDIISKYYILIYIIYIYCIYIYIHTQYIYYIIYIYIYTHRKYIPVWASGSQSQHHVMPGSVQQSGKVRPNK